MYSAVYVIETWWVSSYTITSTFEAHQFYHYSMPDVIVSPVYAGERIRNRTNKRCIHCSVRDWDLVSFIVHYHCIFEAHKSYHYSMPDLIVCLVYAGERIRNRTNKRCIQWCTWLRLGEFHHTLSLHIWSTQILPLFNAWSDRLSCIMCREQIRNCTNKRCIQRCTWLRLGEFHHTLSLAHLKHTNSTIIQCLMWSFLLYMQENE